MNNISLINGRVAKVTGEINEMTAMMTVVTNIPAPEYNTASISECDDKVCREGRDTPVYSLLEMYRHSVFHESLL